MPNIFGVCPVCEQTLDADGYCGNTQCHYRPLKRHLATEDGGKPFPWFVLAVVLTLVALGLAIGFMK